MLETIILAVLGLVALILAIAATRPATFRVARSIEIAAPAERIFPLIDDLGKFRTWSPFEKLDPNLQRAFSGPARGKGTAYAWEGNRNVGKGSMQIFESTPPSRVGINLHFDRPFTADSIVEFTLEPIGAATKVTWAMHGPSPFISKLMGLFCSMDRMCGGQFEEGLANLKRLAEGPTSA